MRGKVAGHNYWGVRATFKLLAYACTVSLTNDATPTVCSGTVISIFNKASHSIFDIGPYALGYVNVSGAYFILYLFIVAPELCTVHFHKSARYALYVTYVSRAIVLY